MGTERLRLERLLPVVAVVAVAFLGPSLGAGFSLADVVILGMIGLWLPMVVREGRPRGVLDVVMLPLLLILFGSLLGSLSVGIQPWIVRDLVKDVGAFVSFLAMVAVLQSDEAPPYRAIAVATAVSAIVVSFMLLSASTLRAQAGFANPNVAAHFVGTNLIVLARSPVPHWLRVLGCAACIVGLIAAGSFGALLMVVGAFTYLWFRSVAPHGRTVLRRVLPVMLLLASVLVMTNLPETTDTTGFNTAHFERSSEGRLTRWGATLEVAAANPLGLGPGSNRGLGLLPHQQEAHNEYLAYLTERGVIGLAGLVLLFAGVWRLGSRGGLTRALVVAFALQGLVRETTHYRHVWILLAYAVVLDQVARRSSRTRDVAMIVGGGP